MAAVRDHTDQLDDALLVVVTFAGDPARLATYQRHLGLDTAVVADVDRRLYALLGAERGSLRRVWLPPSPDARPPIGELVLAVREAISDVRHHP